MKLTNHAILLLIVLLLPMSQTRGQGTSALGFLAMPVSPEQNGMGGTSVAVPSEHSMAPIGNPAQLGMSSLRNFVSAGLYAPKADWQQFSLADLSLNTTAVNAGINCADLVDLPFPVSFGLGYSREYLNLGTFTLTGPGGPTPIGTFTAYNKSEEISLGVGVTYIVTLSIGVGFKFIQSELSPVGTEQEQGSGSASTSATDFGMMLRIPVPDVASSLGAGSLDVLPGVRPLFDIDLGFARSNIGGEVVYNDPAQADPLPRMANLGAGMRLGLLTSQRGVTMEFVSFTLAREAEQLLVERYPDGTWAYGSGFGQIAFFENVIGGRSTDAVAVRKGWEIQCAEFFALRGGSYDQQGSGYTTTGFGIRLSGLFKGLLFLRPEIVEGTWFEWVVRSIDLVYDHSSLESRGSSGSPPATSFNSLNLVVRAVPF